MAEVKGLKPWLNNQLNSKASMSGGGNGNNRNGSALQRNLQQPSVHRKICPRCKTLPDMYYFYQVEWQRLSLLRPPSQDKAKA
jgi:hypothetical protein